MFGKGSLIVVLGAVIIFSLFQLKLSRSVLSSTDNFNYQFVKTSVHENALSAMNLGIQDIWQNKTTSASYNIISDACTSEVVITPVGADSVKARVTSWAYGYSEDALSNNRQKIQDSIYAYFSYTIPISRYFWFTQSEGSVYWISGDTVWGPLHTNGVLRTAGEPVFYGKVTAYQGISPNPYSWQNHAHYHGGWEVGIKIDIPTDMTHLYNAAAVGNGGAAINTKCFYDQDASFEFIADGTVIRQVGTDPPDTVTVSSIAPTGVIYSYADVRVKGTLNGQVTIYSQDDIWIDDDLIYGENPLENTSSDDYLGLVARDYVYVTDNAANQSNCIIHGSIMAINNKFQAQNYDTRSPSGTLTVLGSIIQKYRGAMGTFNSYTKQILTGFQKNYRFDNRLRSNSAPYFPFIRQLYLVSWWE